MRGLRKSDSTVTMFPMPDPPSFPFLPLSIHLSSQCRMPPKTKDLVSVPEDAVLGLQDWLKLLSSHGVTMRTGMALAAKA